MDSFKALAAFAVAAALVCTGCASTGSNLVRPVDSYAAASNVATSEAAQAVSKLENGNKRFIAGTPANKDISNARRQELALQGQHPFAVIISCSDSRVPPELIFDQALGELFVVRVAGNVLDPVSLGSVEYVVEHLHTPLIVVMGHATCGAVTAAVDGGKPQGNMDAFICKINPAVAKAASSGLHGNDLVQKVVELNVANSLTEVNKSVLIAELIQRGKVKLLGAEYYLESGQVKWLS